VDLIFEDGLVFDGQLLQFLIHLVVLQGDSIGHFIDVLFRLFDELFYFIVNVIVVEFLLLDFVYLLL
jgi:hypothetical protein